MPRIPRKYVRTSFYHIMCQGIKKENIFNTNEKMNKYLELIKKYKDEFAINLVTYCVMPNHVHLLIHTDSINNLSKFMHKLNGTYGMYYNKKENRIGYVFRNRFRMEGIESDKYIFNCILYIHNNPVVAGICKSPSEYYYSGYKEYIGKSEIINNKIMKNILGDITYQEKEKTHVCEKINYLDAYIDADAICSQILKSFMNINNLTFQNILKDDSILTKLLVELIIKNHLSYSCVEKNLLINRKKIAKLCPKKGQF